MLAGAKKFITDLACPSAGPIRQEISRPKFCCDSGRLSQNRELMSEDSASSPPDLDIEQVARLFTIPIEPAKALLKVLMD